MNVLENMYRFCKELRHHVDHLSSQVRNDESWDAHRSWDLTEIDNNALFLMSEVIELDKVLNGVDDFERKSLNALRTSCQKVIK